MFFNRSWTEFRREFESLSSQYWIGLDRLHQLSQWNCRARFDVRFRRFSGLYYAQYSKFLVGNSTDKFRLAIGGFSGNIIDAMNLASGTPFSTYDASNGHSIGNCAGNMGGGFWHGSGFCTLARVTTSPNNNFLWNTPGFDLKWNPLNYVYCVSLDKYNHARYRRAVAYFGGGIGWPLRRKIVLAIGKKKRNMVSLPLV